MPVSVGGVSSRKMIGLELLTGKEFFTNLTADVALARPGDRVLITTMCFDPGEAEVRTLMCEVRRAAKRGATVYMGVDAFALMELRALGPVVTPWVLKPFAHRHKISVLEDLGRMGKTSVLHQPRRPVTSLLAGRCHIKVAIVNNRVYLGGPNLQFTWRYNLVVSFEDAAVANWLYKKCAAIIECGSVQAVLGNEDVVLPIDKSTEILIDVGRRGKSAILDHGYKIIDCGREWVTIACQYLPYGATGDHLAAAMRSGIKVEILSNYPHNHDRGVLAHRIIHTAQRVVRPPTYFDHLLHPSLTLMHAKAVANEAEAMVGSHDLITATVRRRTAEMSIRRRHPAFAAEVRAALWRQLEQPVGRQPCFVDTHEQPKRPSHLRLD